MPLIRATLVLLAASFSFGLASPAVAADRPNVVIILADDLGWADVGFHGSTNKTPRLDRLARDGVELTRQYCYPVCSPTRAALMTGRFASRFGVTTAQNEQALPPGTLTLASALHTAGYDTAITGKWHLGSKPEWGPDHYGFDHAYGPLAGGTGPDDHRYKTGPYSANWHRNGQYVDEPGHVTDLLADEAVRWLEARRGADRPFFLYVPFTAVHIPIREPQPYLDLYPDVEPLSRRHFAACVSHLDAAVGRLVDALERIGARERTLVLFLSDNGATPTARNDDPLYPDGKQYPPGPAGGSNLPLRANKTTLYEGGIRVTALASWPGTLRPGRCEQVIHAADWTPTILAAAGVTPATDPRFDGRDIGPAFAGAAPEPRTLYWAGLRFESAAVRDGDLKLLRFTAPARPPRFELYDVTADPSEKHDLVVERPADAARLQALLDRLSQADNDARVVKQPAARVPK